MTLLEMKNVTFGYGRGQRVLDGVSLKVEAGRNLGIVGESGSGKTTMLRLLLGLASPVAGEIALKGRAVDLSNRGFMRDFRRSMQAVFQDPYSSLDPRQSVFDIIAEPIRSLKTGFDPKQAVAQALASVGLPADAASRYPHEFSGGQRQRIAIARAIVTRPEIILADEVVSALDLSTRVRIVELLKELSNTVTLVLVSHDISLVALLCDELVILERGRIVESGPTREILANPKNAYTQKLLASTPRFPQYD